MEDDAVVRVLLMGKTGSGKSSFINYFLNEDVAKTGSGKPVTQHINKYNMTINNMKTELFDTKGLEVLNVSEILNEIVDEIKKRNNQDDVLKWFHTIFYCVSMKHTRLEDFEINLIKEIRNNISQQIHIIITNCDNQEQSKIDAMKQKIMNDIDKNARIYPVCNVTATNRAGKTSIPFGKELLQDELFKFLWSDITKKIAITIENKLKYSLRDCINNMYDRANKELDKFKTTKLIKAAYKDDFSDIERILNDMEEDFDEYIKNIGDTTDRDIMKSLQPAVKLYNTYYNLLHNSNRIDIDNYDFQSFTNEVFDFDDDIFDIALKNSKLGMLADEVEQLDTPEFSKDTLILLGKSIGIAFTWKKYIKELLDLLMNELLKEMNKCEFKKVIYKELISMIK